MKETIKVITELPIERWREYKDIKLESLKNDPDAFSDQLSDLEQEPDSYWINALSKNKIKIFVECEGNLVGFIACKVFSSERYNHNAFLSSFYVSPSFRGMGYGKLLIKKAVDLVLENKKVKNIISEIISSQQASVAIHNDLGFKECGRFKDFINVSGEYFDKVIFVKTIN